MNTQNQIGPFTKENFHQPTWLGVQNKLYALNFSPKLEILPEYNQFLQLLTEANTYSDYNQYFQEPSAKEFFLNKFFPLIALSLANCKPGDNAQIAEFIQRCLQQMIILWLKNISLDSHSLTEAAQIILDPSRGLYQVKLAAGNSFIGIKPSGPSTVDDKTDEPYSPEEKRIYAVTREDFSSSQFLVSLINDFGESNGFDRMYERIADTENSLSIEIMSLMCSIISHICPILHRQFALEYIPKIKEVVSSNLLSSSESKISNYSKVTGILDPFSTLLKRIYSVPESKQLVEDLKLKLCGRYFEFCTQESNLLGLNMLSSFISNTNQAENGDAIKDFIKKNGILANIYTIKNQSKFIQKSKDFLQYCIKEKILSLEDLVEIWKVATEGDKETKVVILGLLSDCVSILPNEHGEFLISSIFKMPLETITNSEISLVTSLKSHFNYAICTNKQIWQFYWELMLSIRKTNTTVPLNTSIALSNLYIACIKGNNGYKNEILNTIDEYIRNIQNNTEVIFSLQRINELIDLFPEDNFSFSKSDCIRNLCKEKQLLVIITKELLTFKANVQEELAATKNYTDTITEDGRFYLSHVSERLRFITYIVSNNSAEHQVFTYEILCDLWNSLIENALVTGERKVGFDFFKEIAELEKNFLVSLDFLRFFRNNITYERLFEINQITLEGFECFKSLFVRVNKKLDHIALIETAFTAKNSLSSEKNPSQGKKEISFSLKVLPEKLEGINSLWRFWRKTDNDTIVKDAADIIVKLYTCADESLLEHTMRTFENHLYMFLKDAMQDCNELTMTKRLEKYFLLVNRAIEESEKEGFGELKSHAESSRGEILDLQINFTILGKIKPLEGELTMHFNDTVMKLKLEIARQFNVAWNKIALFKKKDADEIEFSQNNKTLQAVDLAGGQKLFAREKILGVISRAKLIELDPNPPKPEEKPQNQTFGLFSTRPKPSNMKLCPRAKEIFCDWFEEFSDEGKMSPENSLALAQSVTNEITLPDHRKVFSLFDLYDNNRDGYLTKEDFLKCWLYSCETSQESVWKNLAISNYRNDLKKVNKLGQVYVDFTLLLRYLVSKNNSHFQLLYSLLDLNKEIADKVWELMSKLPTNPQVFENIVMLKGIRDHQTPAKEDWDTLLCAKSDYKLLYSLKVIAGLLEEKNNRKDKFRNPFLWSYNEELAKYRDAWPSDFLNLGGEAYLDEILDKVIEKNYEKPDCISEDTECLIAYMKPHLKDIWF